MDGEQKGAGPSSTSQVPGGVAFNASVAPSRVKLLQLPYVAQLRPSTLLGYLVSCAPSQLPSPHDVDGRSLASYVADLTDISVEKAHPHAADAQLRSRWAYSIRSLYPVGGSLSPIWGKIESEVKCWNAVQQCEDIFFQRITVADGMNKQQMRAWHEAILDMGNFYFGGR